MSATLSRFSAPRRTAAAATPSPTGGALTGPRPDVLERPTEPMVLRSAALHAVVRDVRRLGEALREPSNAARCSALRRHLRFLLDELDAGDPVTRRLRSAVDNWSHDDGRNTVREAVLAVESALAPEYDENFGCRAADAPAGGTGPGLLAPGDRRITPARLWWLLDGLAERDAAAVRRSMTGPRWWLARVLGSRRERQRQLLWN